MQLKSYLYGFTALIAFVNLSYGAESILQENAELKKEYKLELKDRAAYKLEFEVERAEGKAEGRAEGEKAKALEVARNLKAMGLKNDQIAAATGLTEADIYALKRI